MATIASPGLATGLDVNSIISKLMELERIPLKRLETKEKNFQAQISAYGAITSALSTLETATKALADTDTFGAKSVTVGDSTVLTASASSSAVAGSYDIVVTQLAKANTVHTNVDYGADTFDSGTLTITIGDGSPIYFDLTAVSTLSEVKDAINAADAGVTASVINDGTADRLVLTSKTSGSDGTIAIAAPTSNGDGTRRLTDLIGANLTTDQAGQDAEFTVNGFAVTRSSNTVTDAIEGVTLNLLKGTAASPGTSTLTVAVDTEATKTAIESFVTAYNSAVTALKTNSAYNATTKVAAALNGDATVRSLQSQLTTLMQTSVAGIAGGISTLSNLGISVQTTGLLEIDDDTLDDVLADPDKDVSALFAQDTVGSEGIAVQFNTVLYAIIGFDGQISNRTDGINDSIDAIGDSRDTLNARLVQIEARYRAQFTALDTLASSMNKTSAYLSQQLSRL